MITPLEPNCSTHATEQQFRRYEKDIVRVCEAWPRTVKFKVLSMTVASYQTAFRNACRMAIHPRFAWPTKVNVDFLRSIFEQGLTFRVRPATREVLLGPKEAFIEPSEDVTREVETTFDGRDNPDILRALTTLKSYEVFVDQIIVCNPHMETVRELVENYPHLAFVLNENGNLIIV